MDYIIVNESNLSPPMPNMNYINPQTAIDYPPLRARTLEKVELANPSNNPVPIANQQEILRGKLPGYDKAVINAEKAGIPVQTNAIESPKMSVENAGDLLRKELMPTPLAKMDEVGYNVRGSAEESGKTNLNGAKVNQGHQDKHIPGTNNYKQEIANGRNKSILSGNPQELLDNYAGIGQKLGPTRERVNFGKVIGQYYDDITGQYIDTTNGIIHYDSKGGAHIVPARP